MNESPVQPKNKNTGVRVLLIVGIATILLVAGLGASMNNTLDSMSDTDTSPTQQSTPKPVETPKPEAPKAPATSFGDGTFKVGEEIEPGTYKSVKNGCYYARLSNFTNEVGSIIASDISNGQSIVTIDATDVGFRSSRCGTWTKVE